MSEQAKAGPSCGDSGRAVPWFPHRRWWQPSPLSSRDVGPPPSPEPWDPRWMDEARRLQMGLAACSWPGLAPAPLFVPYICGSMRPLEQEVGERQYKWTVSLDVSHFSPEEVSLSVRGRFLEVAGRHEERPDEHGFIARCFTRKYRLPAEVDVTNITSTLSVDGILTVEAPVPETSVPAAIIIPIKVETEVTEEAESPDASGDKSREPEEPDLPCAESDGGESPLEVHGDQAHPDGTTAGERRGQEEEEDEEEEETCGKPAEESQPPAPADGKGTESLQESSEQRETSESQESPDTGSQEHKEAAADGEIPAMAGAGEAAEEMARPEEPEQEPGVSPGSEEASQDLEALDMKQEHTE